MLQDVGTELDWALSAQRGLGYWAAGRRFRRQTAHDVRDPVDQEVAIEDGSRALFRAVLAPVLELLEGLFHGRGHGGCT